MEKNNIFFGQDRRQYIRVDTVFPIEFQIVSDDRSIVISEIKEGFSRNIGKGGMCITTKVVKDATLSEFTPNKTKLKLIINIPANQEPLESFATVEWIEKFSGSLVDTYTIGVSYDFINESEYEKIIRYIKWLRLKPIILTSSVIILSTILLVLLVFIFNSERLSKATKGLFLSKEMLQKTEAELADKKDELTNLQKEIENLQTLLKSQEKIGLELETKRKELEKYLKEAETNKESLRSELNTIKEEYASIDKELAAKKEEETTIKTSESENKPLEETKKISDEILKLEEDNYNNFRELILQEKVQGLEVYCASHQSSIYYPASLFALAEIQYKNRNITFARTNYNKLVENFPDSKYGLYASHRLEQINNNINYENASLKDLADKYSLPELSDYRKIEPYSKK